MSRLAALDPGSHGYAHAVRVAIEGAAGSDVVGIYVYGSAVTGSFVRHQSDLDLLVVTHRWLGRERIRRLLSEVREVPLPAAIKGLDMWVVPLDGARHPRPDPVYEAWLLTSINSKMFGGPDHPGDARLVLLFAMCRDHGVPVVGPPARTVFGPLDRQWVVDAMRVDLGLMGPSGWYRVLNACRTLHFLVEGSMCGKLSGAAWARERVGDPWLIDAAVEWRRSGFGPPLPPGSVEQFVSEVASLLAAESTMTVPVGIPAAERGPHTALTQRPLVTCVMAAPSDPDLLGLAARRFCQQDWPERELLVLFPPGGVDRSALPIDPRIRAIDVRHEELDHWRRVALTHTRGELIATWDALTWYSPDRLSQQVREMLSTFAPRIVTPRLLAYDVASRNARWIREPEILERSTLCAHRHAWEQVGAAARRGERSEIALILDPGVARTRGEPAETADALSLLGDQLAVYEVVVSTSFSMRGSMPPVSCLMPTYNRRRFAERAIRSFLDQDYPNKELVILDDGEDPIEDLVQAGTPVRYHRLNERATIGKKRQLACELADGDLLVQWDDDDWYGPARLRRQLAPLATGSADISGIVQSYLFDLSTLRFWKGELPLHEGRLYAMIVAGTLGFTRLAWQSTDGYPDRSLGEEVALLEAVIDRGGRVASIVNDGIYMCVRHASNSWRLRFDAIQGPPGWVAVPSPDFLPEQELEFYRSLAKRMVLGSSRGRPLDSRRAESACTGDTGAVESSLANRERRSDDQVRSD